MTNHQRSYFRFYLPAEYPVEKQFRTCIITPLLPVLHRKSDIGPDLERYLETIGHYASLHSPGRALRQRALVHDRNSRVKIQ